MVNFLSQNLLYLRKKRKLRQDEMQQQCGISRGTWSNYENGISEPNVDALITISKFFGVVVTELLTSDLEKTHLMDEKSDSNIIGKSTPNRTPNSTPNEENPKNYEENDAISIVQDNGPAIITIYQAKYFDLLEKYSQLLESKLIEHEFRYRFEDVSASVKALRELIINADSQDLTLPSQKEAFFHKKKQDEFVKSGILSGDSM